MAETNAAVSTKSQEESQKAFKERLLKIMGADATEAYLKAYGFDEGNAFARNYDGTLPAEGEEPAFFTNIDEQGNVLFLDEDRALRKSSFPGKRPVYRNKPNGLGFFNFLVVHTSARQWNWKVVLKVFAAILSASKVLSKPGTFGDRLYRKAMMFDPPEKSYSAGFTFNLNVDVPEDVPGTAKYNDFVVHKNPHHAQEEFACKHMQLEAEGADGAEVASGQAASASGQAAAAAGAAGTTGTQAASADAADKPKTITLNKVVSKNVAHDMATVTLPIDLVKKAIDEAEFIGGMKECLCRAGGDCQTYPHDLACLFLNLGGHVVVDHGMAVELTKEEAYERVDRAAALGLTCQSLWVQVEQLIWGFRNEQMDSFLEICFCCPCCCVGMNLSKNGPRNIKRGFMPSGWTATVNHDLCTGCGHCTDSYCPQDAIHFRESDGKMVVNQETCQGCGYCRGRCPEGAISIKQTMPMRDSILEYFHEQVQLDIVPGVYRK